MTILKFLSVSSFLLILTSCLKNPEAGIQNERIKDLQEKNSYILDIVKEQNEKISELEDRINILEKVPVNKFRKFRRSEKKNDTLNVKIFERNTSKRTSE